MSELEAPVGGQELVERLRDKYDEEYTSETCAVCRDLWAAIAALTAAPPAPSPDGWAEYERLAGAWEDAIVARVRAEADDECDTNRKLIERLDRLGRAEDRTREAVRTHVRKLIGTPPVAPQPSGNGKLRPWGKEFACGCTWATDSAASAGDVCPDHGARIVAAGYLEIPKEPGTPPVAAGARPSAGDCPWCKSGFGLNPLGTCAKCEKVSRRGHDRPADKCEVCEAPAVGRTVDDVNLCAKHAPAADETCPHGVNRWQLRCPDCEKAARYPGEAAPNTEADHA